MLKFNAGQRVLFTSHSQGFHAASLGVSDKVMYLNRKDDKGNVIPITGTVLSFNGLLEMYAFQPDDWPDWAAGVNGFYIDEDSLSEMPDPDLRLPGVITNAVGGAFVKIRSF